MTIAANANGLELVQDWDKTFPKSDKVEHCKAAFKNRFGITLAADVYKPKAGSGKFAAIAVSGPFGAADVELTDGEYAAINDALGSIAIYGCRDGKDIKKLGTVPDNVIR